VTSELRLRRRFLAASYTEKELARMLREGRLSVIRPGTYLSGSPPPDAETAHRLAARAAIERC
jgi:hypothetical protein